MKKLLIVLLALGLVFSFSAPVMATDISVSGTYYIRGWYDANSALNEESTSNALYQQRLRVKTVFQVAEGLKLTTRFDALEQTWGSHAPMSQSSPDPNGVTSGYTNDMPGGNIKMELTRMDFTTPYGLISAGYWDTNSWGLTFGNNTWKVGRVQWVAPVGPIIAIAGLEKDYEGDNGDTYSDYDGDAYILAALYKKEDLTAGIIWKYVDYAQYRDLPAIPGVVHPFNLTASVLVPTVQATVGPVHVEAELYYAFGEKEMEDLPGKPDDVDMEGLSCIVEGNMDVGPGYVGAVFAYAQGDDPGSDDAEGSFVNGGWDWNPCLILWNDDFYYKATGALGHAAGAMTDGQMRNAMLYQVYAGMSPLENLSVRGSLTYAEADEAYLYGTDTECEDDYGTELDISAVYKIYDNLEYMVGFGYFWAGDFYEGDKDNPTEIDDEYLLLHKLTLSF